MKVQAGHCTGADLSRCHGVTHLFNAISVDHRSKSTALSALLDDKIYTEIIADGVHLSDDILELARSKPEDKIILVSDSLPIAASGLNEIEFAGEKIYFDGNQKATSSTGTIAGSTAVLDEIIEKTFAN